MMAKKYTMPHARFFLIEPGVVAYQILQSLKSSSISVHHLGLSDSNGTLKFYEENNAGEQSSFVVTGYHKHYKTANVIVQTLDQFSIENDIDTIDFLKIDCEGFDYKVLLGASKLLSENRVKYIQFEYGSSWRIAGATLKAAVNFLNQFGFSVWVLKPDGLVEFDIDYYGEYFEYSNFFAAKQLPENLS